MSHTYCVNGYVDLRVFVKEMDVSASQSSSPEDIAELVKNRISRCMICEIIGHKLIIES